MDNQDLRTLKILEEIERDKVLNDGLRAKVAEAISAFKGKPI